MASLCPNVMRLILPARLRREQAADSLSDMAAMFNVSLPTIARPKSEAGALDGRSHGIGRMAD
jgi:hypothetical protein